LIFGFFTAAISAAPILIDDFSSPGGGGTSYVISANHPDPSLFKVSSLGILGGERDLLVDVNGTPGTVSAKGHIGGAGGIYRFRSAGVVGTTATLQYDGVDPDVVGPPASLVNAGSLGGADLINGGNLGLLFTFLSVDGGAGSTLGLNIVATGPSGSVTYTGLVPENPSSFAFFAPFSSFLPSSGTFSFNIVSSLEIKLNPLAVANVEFELDAVVATIPEPHSLALTGLAMTGIIALRRRDQRVAT